MEMDFMQEFTRAWNTAFPDQTHPCHERLCACLGPSSGSSSVSSMSSIASVSEARLGDIEDLRKEYADKADQLELEARQQRFIANFLDRMLLKLSRAPDAQYMGSISSESSDSPQTPNLRSGKLSLVSPIVPRGTLHKVKNALRQSGMLLDSSIQYADESVDDGEISDDDDDELEIESTHTKLQRRFAYVSNRGRKQGEIPPAPSTPPPELSSQATYGDGDCDSLDDYLYESLSDSHEVDVEMDTEVPTKRQNSDVYVSVEEIQRKKRMSTSGVNASPGPKTLHDRLSTFDWRAADSAVYEKLENVSSEKVCHRNRDRREMNRHVHLHVEKTPEEDEEEEEDPYSPLDDVEDDGEVDVTGADRTQLAVQRRLGLAMYQQEHAVIPKTQPVPPGQLDYKMMLKDATGDPRYQELIHIHKSEVNHRQVLKIMDGCRSAFRAYKFPEQKIKLIFDHADRLVATQDKFMAKLEQCLKNWQANTNVADVFAVLNNFQDLKEYITNIPTAIKTYEEVMSESREFAQSSEAKNRKDSEQETHAMGMDPDIIQQPVMWLTQSAENIKRIINYTPEGHPDRKPLENLLHHLLGMMKSGTFNRNQKERTVSMLGMAMSEGSARSLERHSLLVELSGNGSNRKLRHVFLFTDIFVCAKPRPPGNVGTCFEVRWVIPISQVVIYKVNDSLTDDMKSKRRAELETLKHRIKEIRKDIKKEVEKDGLPTRHKFRSPYASPEPNELCPWCSKRSSFRRWNWAPGRRGIDKLKEQLHKTQAQLVLLSPNLEFKISSGNEKKHTLLMSSEFERRSWTDDLRAFKNAAANATSAPTLSHPSFSDVQVLLEDYKDMVCVNKLGSCLLHDGQEGCISGILKVTIHRVEGLKEPINCIVFVEVDSFEHFDLFAKTTPVGPSSDPVVNQEFDIELDFSTTVRFIICHESVESDGRQNHQNIAKLELRLDVESLSQYVEIPHGLATFADPSHSILLTLSLGYRATHETLARQLSERRGGLFGIPLKRVVNREMRHAPRGTPPSQVPIIIRACTSELDKRALEEPGIYRISGMSADVTKLKSSFDTNVTATSKLLGDYEVHVISGVLKAYLRELPEPLFTVERYREFMDAFELSPIEVKRDAFIRLLTSLPEPNLSTARHLLHHFARINRKSDINKMVSGNLGLIFGPTLLCPASTVLPCDILSVTMESFKQSGTLTYMIALTTDGKVFAD